MESILHQAEQLENNYDWLAATESYERALKLLPDDDFSRKGKIHERLGYAFYRFAFQAESNDEFRKRLHQAILSYEKAKGLYGRLNGSARAPSMSRFDAVIFYIGYWLASEAPEKKKSLAECWRSTQEALEALSASGEIKEYGETYNQLSASALLAFCSEWDYQARKKIIEKVAEYGEAGIKLLSAVDEPDEFAKTCAKTAFSLSLFAYYFLDLDEKENCLRKAQTYWTRAKEASEGSATLEMLCPVSCAHDLLWGSGSQEALANVEKALEFGKRTKDKFIIGSALDWLAYHTTWATAEIDDYVELASVQSRIIQYADDARRHYSVISFMSPRADNAWIEAIHAQIMPGYNPQTALEKRRDMLERAIAAGRDAVEPAENSGYPDAKLFVNLHLSGNLRRLAELESNPEERKKLLEEALHHGIEASRIGEQIEPLSYWDLGIHRGVLATIKCDLADLAKGTETKRSMLQAAIIERENALKLLVKDVSFHPEKKTTNIVFLGYQQYLAGGWWSRLYRLTCDRDHLRNAIEVFTDALERARAQDRTNLMAECHWKIAQVFDELDDPLTAAKNFCLASDSFKDAAKKISQLKDFYEDHALYMQAWNEIETARHHHERQEYGSAKEHFEKAAELHQSLKKWSYLASNYFAWVQVEDAEDLSRKERIEEAIDAFERADSLFGEAKKSLGAHVGKIEGSDEKQMVADLVKATDVRQEYCMARITLEQARKMDKDGDHFSSSEKYGSAVKAFERIFEALDSDQEKRDIKFAMNLSQAWQKMTLAEAKSSPALYTEASQLFEQTEDFSPNEKTKMLVLGHSRFCRALEAGTKYADTRDPAMHKAAVQHLASASNYYIRADFLNASEYAKATKLLFDAYAYMDDAEGESDPDKKAKLYTMVEKVLQTSAGSFTKAEHPEKREQVLKLLEKARDERELAASLNEVMHAPPIVSTTRVLTAPTPTHEEAVGSERFEHADVQANLIIRQKELKVGEDLKVEVELVNAGRAPAILIKLSEIIPEGFELVDKPEIYRLEDSYLNMKGKRLDALKPEEIKITMKPKSQGVFKLRPRISYLDENSKYRYYDTEPVSVVVKELGIKGWLKGER